MKKKLITQSDDLIAQGVAKKLIRIGDDGKRIEYLRHGISRDWTKPEAIIEAKAYLTLVLQYEYPDDRIRLFAPVTVGSSLREADIEVFADAKHESPIIIVEYKAAADQIAAVAEKAVAELRDKLDSEYKSAAAEAFPDEDIFMAIADDIGFDATGKPTKVNELDEIGVALADFINEEAEA